MTRRPLLLPRSPHAPLAQLTLLALLAPLALLALPASAAQDGVPPVRPAAGVPAPERVAWFAKFQDERSGPESTETVTRTFKVGPHGSLDIFNLAGPIVINGAAGDEIVLTAIKRVRGGSGDTRSQLDAIMIDAQETAGRVEVRTVARRTKHLSTWVDYTVQVPFGTAVSARSLAGDLKVTKVRGEVQLESANGAVEAIGTPKLARVKTLSGDILIADGGSAEGLSASTVSGRLVVKGVKTRTLDLATISGDLVLVNIACDRAQVRSVSGTMEFAGPLVRNGRYEFTSHAGDVRLALAGSQGFELAAKTFSGQVHSDLPLTLNPTDPALPPGAPERRDVRGIFGDGSALVIVKTFSGSVAVTRAEGDKAAKPKHDKK
ncbi:MAG: DUF4097 family beta strand repeat protein [Vicinamibacteria bacterium]|nr:DUF4097 family beta strand repeat protein [Vicinamibacteria bacterium]